MGESKVESNSILKTKTCFQNAYPASPAYPWLLLYLAWNQRKETYRFSKTTWSTVNIVNMINFPDPMTRPIGPRCHLPPTKPSSWWQCHWTLQHAPWVPSCTSSPCHCPGRCGGKGKWHSTQPPMDKLMPGPAHPLHLEWKGSCDYLYMMIEEIMSPYISAVHVYGPRRPRSMVSVPILTFNSICASANLYLQHCIFSGCPRLEKQRCLFEFEFQEVWSLDAAWTCPQCHKFTSSRSRAKEFGNPAKSDNRLSILPQGIY